jgi:hypothetical protein
MESESAPDQAARSAAEVFASHLELRKKQDVEGDIAANYAQDVVLITCTGVFRGHDGVRASARELNRYFPDGKFDYVVRTVDGEVAFLVWTGHSPAGEVKDGSDTFVIRNGRIVAQTIHYTVDRG